MDGLFSFVLSREAISGLYILVIVSLSVWAVGSVYWWFNWFAKRRKRTLRSREFVQAIPTDSPLDDPDGIAKKRAIKSVESHFTITRKIILPTLLAIAITIIAIPFLDKFPAALLSLAIGAVTVVVGTAAKPVIENIIAGLVIASSKVLNIGDTIKIDDIYGTVEDITPTYTTIKVWDWRRYIVPNARMLQAEFLNYTLTDRFVWANVEFWVAFGTNIEQVKSLAIAAAEGSTAYASYEPPRFWVMELGKAGIRCWVAAWADGPDEAWQLKADIRHTMAMTFREHNIDGHCYCHDFRSRSETDSNQSVDIPFEPSMAD